MEAREEVIVKQIKLTLANVKVPGTALQTSYINSQLLDPGEPGFAFGLRLRSSGFVLRTTP